MSKGIGEVMAVLDGESGALDEVRTRVADAGRALRDLDGAVGVGGCVARELSLLGAARFCGYEAWVNDALRVVDSAYEILDAWDACRDGGRTHRALARAVRVWREADADEKASEDVRRAVEEKLRRAADLVAEDADGGAVDGLADAAMVRVDLAREALHAFVDEVVRRCEAS